MEKRLVCDALKNPNGNGSVFILFGPISIGSATIGSSSAVVLCAVTAIVLNRAGREA